MTDRGPDTSPPPAGEKARRAAGRRGLARRVAAAALMMAVASVVEHLVVWTCAGRGWAVVDGGWIFPPRVRAEVVSAEFRHTVETSSQGLRDRNFAIPAPPGTLRVAAVGDSYTFGWGVEAGQTWVKALERGLGADRPGRPVEVVNLGMPAGEPDAYARLCEARLAKLRPDLLIVAITQGDDLTQLGLRRDDATAPPGPEKRLLGALQAAFPILVPRCRELFRRCHDPLLNPSRQQPRDVIARLGPDGALRYRALDAEIRDQFERGLINPFLIETGCRFPRFFSMTLDPSRPAMARASRALRKSLGRIAATCRATGTPWVVVSVPNGLYVSPEALVSRRRLGFETPEELLRTEAPERVVADACEAVGVPFVSVTAEVRRLAPSGAYYPIDGHATAAGNALFAALLAPRISARLDAAARPDLASRPSGAAVR
jgi:hypothetical protein